MARQLSTGELNALAQMTREFEAIRRQFHREDRLNVELSVVPDELQDVAIADWEDLFQAVKARLIQCVDELLAAISAQGFSDTSAGVQASVRECVAALDQLHLTLAHAVAGRHAPALAMQGGPTAQFDRIAFRDRVDQGLASAATPPATLGLLYIDLDGFAEINATHGQGSSDELLATVAARLAQGVRPPDRVIHLGGDEFVCLLADWHDREQLGQLACELFDAVSAPMTMGGIELSVRPVIGIAVSPDDGTTAEALLVSADAAMIRAKRQQTGYAFVDRHSDH